MKNDVFDNYHKWEVGDIVELTHKIVEKDVFDFASLTGDQNPLHVDTKYAANTNFGQRVVHGMLSASFISTIIGMKLPGAGALWLSQTLDFKAPARIGDIIKVIAEVNCKSDSQRILELGVSVVNQNQQILISGVSKIKVIEERQEEEIDKKDKTKKGAAIITGASRGIGSAAAKRLASDGYPVVINFSRSSEEATLVLNEIIKQGGEATLYKADVTNDAEVKELVDYSIYAFGSVDILVNNAGGPIINKKFNDLQWADIQKHLDVQVKGAFNLCKCVIPSMKAQKYGKIINISSIYTDGVPPIQTYDYIVAKSALSALTRSLAMEFGVNGIRVNNVSPGMTETTLIGNIPEKTKLVIQMQAPLRRLATVDDVSNIISMLASEAGDYLTGETIRVCGGQRML